MHVSTLDGKIGVEDGEALAGAVRLESAAKGARLAGDAQTRAEAERDRLRKSIESRESSPTLVLIAARNFGRLSTIAAWADDPTADYPGPSVERVESESCLSDLLARGPTTTAEWLSSTIFAAHARARGRLARIAEEFDDSPHRRRDPAMAADLVERLEYRAKLVAERDFLVDRLARMPRDDFATTLGANVAGAVAKSGGTSVVVNGLAMIERLGARPEADNPQLSPLIREADNLRKRIAEIGDVSAGWGGDDLREQLADVEGRADAMRIGFVTSSRKYLARRLELATGGDLAAVADILGSLGVGKGSAVVAARDAILSAVRATMAGCGGPLLAALEILAYRSS
jgi:hypothetical protein